MQDKMDLQTNVGLCESNTSDDKISGKTKVTRMGESKSCTETDSLKTEIVHEKLFQRIQEKEGFQQIVGLSESGANHEKISDTTNVTMIGESETCCEADISRTEKAEGKLCNSMQNKTDLQDSLGLIASDTNDDKICGDISMQDKTDLQDSLGLIASDTNDDKICGDISMQDKTDLQDSLGLIASDTNDDKICGDISMQDKTDLQDSRELIASDTNDDKICGDTNVIIVGENIACLERNENKDENIESKDEQGSKDASQVAGVSGNDLDKLIGDCNPVPDGGNADEVCSMPSERTDYTCGTKVSLTSPADRCQKSTIDQNGDVQSGKTIEVTHSTNNHSTAASSLVVIKSKNDFTVSRSPVAIASLKTFRPVAKLLHDIGLDLVTEWVCHDLIHIQTQTTTISPLPEAEKSRQLSVLAANEQRLTKRNKPFALQKRRCKCGFLTESQNVLTFHRLFGDVSRNGDMHCCMCSFKAEIPRYFSRHLKRKHKLKALVIVKMAQYLCHFCPFENNLQTRIESHLAKCGKLFNLNFNLCPVRMDCDIPVFGDAQKYQSTVASASTPANHLFSTGGLPSQLPLHSSMPSSSLKMPQPQQGATIPSSLTLSLPLTRFIVAPAISPIMPRIQLSVVPPKSQNAAQHRSVVSSMVSQSATQNNFQANLMVSHSQRGVVGLLSSNLAQNLPQTGVTIPPLLGKGAPQSRLGVPSSVTLVRPEQCALVPRGFGPDLLRMQLLASPQTPIMQLQNPRNSSGTETRFIQLGNQICTIVQHQGRSILTPLIFPPPVLPFGSSYSLNAQPTLSVGKQNSTQPSSIVLSSNISAPRGAVSFVRMPQLQPSTCTNQPSFCLEICEICDGFVKDRRSLSVHFRNAHRVVIDELNCIAPSQPCTLCKQSFFTISGLLRHYRIVHTRDSRLIKSLVSCSLCQNVNLKDAVEHLSSHHRDTMSMSDEFKHCGICSLHLRDVQSFEKHMLLVHSNLFASRNILLATIAASLSDRTRMERDSNARGFNGQMNESSKKIRKASHICKTCGLIYLTVEELNNHITKNHRHKCSRCREAFNCLASLRRHFYMKHSTERESCPLCLQIVQIGRPFIRHMKSQHLKGCSVKLERMHDSKVFEDQAKRRTNKSVKLPNSSLKRTSTPVDKGSLKCNEDLFSESAKKQKLESGQS